MQYSVTGPTKSYRVFQNFPDFDQKCCFTSLRNRASAQQTTRERVAETTGKTNRFPFLDILGYLKNNHKNPKFGRVRQVPTRELGWEFPGWDLSHFTRFGIFMGIL